MPEMCAEAVGLAQESRYSSSPQSAGNPTHLSAPKMAASSPSWRPFLFLGFGYLIRPRPALGNRPLGAFATNAGYLSGLRPYFALEGSW
jgi:hypothetical protein